MMDLQLLKTFLTVAAGLSFRKAAETLNYAPSTVTAQIKALEEDLGIPLFDRLGRRVLLTEHGQRLLHHARRMVDLEAETRRILLDGEASVELAVRISESLGIHCLPWVLPRFRGRSPATRLNLTTHSQHGLVRDLRHGVTDLALLLGEPFSAAGLHVDVLHRERLVVIVPPESPLAIRQTVHPADLEGVPLILTRHVWSVRRLIEQALSEAHVGIEGLVECSSVEIVKRCVMAGQGISVVPSFTVQEEVRQKRLASLDWAGEPLVAPVLLVRHEERSLSPAAAAFIDLLQAFFGEGRASESST
ncbi:transcriptional regulator [Desulfocurvibacter africanus PCS]|uniref:Transcriptional regulator n=1 Tax=Desulfocurvibacter africanus PCS TaxID=1262666 RepID=M5PQR2_DESAF|nr:LysR family transcriptional regulator [Desulfocurvibacter africanus]EMG36697.1 transcriptional regulator [Desulfocurvibacter africanus PCS]